MPLFKKLVGGAQNLLKKASGNLDVGLRKISNTAGTVGSYIDKATPYISMVNPELGAMAGEASSTIQQGRGLIKGVRGINQSVASGDISGGIQKAMNLSQNTQPQASFY